MSATAEQTEKAFNMFFEAVDDDRAIVASTGQGDASARA